MRISKLTKGQVRKLRALRKSLGSKIADPAFSKWLKTQKSNKSGGKTDPVAEKLERSLKSLASKKINLGTWDTRSNVQRVRVQKVSSQPETKNPVRS